ncbi:hypothetical protein H6X68_04645 [Actinomyces sp. 186855]|nr:hypothetical protein [Actinomyces sp. AC-20-1]MCL3789701.1 hypothetical protein [Actinomyces sp. 187325]MCL3791886.1 hypothetical protein [Actinomyces sp. 186855]MCL3794453.1 hypothetical protein [Actinomyces sp. 217892]
MHTVLVIASVLLLSSLGGWGVVAVILRWARVPETPVQRAAGPGGASVPVIAPRDEPGSPVLRGGAWIGVLERLAVTGVLLAGQPVLTGAVVAVKGLGRWADLQGNPGSTERFIIGTLASLVWAGACGLAGRTLLG